MAGNNQAVKMATVFDENEAIDELLVFLRNSDILTTTQRNVTTATETFSGTGSTTNFSFTNTSVKNVRSVTVNSVAQTNYVDYTINYVDGEIDFTSAPASGTDNVEVSLDHGSDRIFDDWPRDDLSINSYPRVSLQLSPMSSTEGDTSGATTFSDALFSVTVFGVNKRSVISVVKSIRNAVINNKTGFTKINFLTVGSQGPMLPNENSKTKILQKNIDLRAPIIIEQ